MWPDLNSRAASAGCDPETGASNTAVGYCDDGEYFYAYSDPDPLGSGILLKPDPVPPAEQYQELKSQVPMPVQFNRRQMFSKSGFLPNRVRRRFKARKNFADRGGGRDG